MLAVSIGCVQAHACGVFLVLVYNWPFFLSLHVWSLGLKSSRAMLWWWLGAGTPPHGHSETVPTPEITQRDRAKAGDVFKSQDGEEWW